ncbi:MAG: bis(5'-nucleosyl)-tetraphosphatase (symmetrical) YqeK [Lachnospiraceae bacterium]
MTEQLIAIKKDLKKKLTKHRMEHTVGVMYMAAALAMQHDIDVEKAMTAGLLHDCAKSMKDPDQLEVCLINNMKMRHVELNNPSLLHAKAGVCLAQNKYGITDAEVLNAIAVHTTGEPDMTTLEKIIFVSDYIEPNRKHIPELKEIRKTAFFDLDLAVYMVLKETIAFLEESDRVMDTLTLDAFDYYKEIIQNRMNKQEKQDR